MTELNILITAGIVVAALVSFIIGLLIGRRKSGNAAKIKQLSESLNRAESQRDHFQHQVSNHFSDTARLLNELTEKYKDVHQHLAQGAEQLCRDAEGNSMLIASPLTGDNKPDEEAMRLDESNPDSIQPPLDYAPKDEQAATGTLAEDFGLEKVNLFEESGSQVSGNEPILTDTFNAENATDPSQGNNPLHAVPIGTAKSDTEKQRA